MSIIKYDSETFTNLLAQFLPDGRAWAAKYCPGTNFRDLLNGLSAEHKRLYDQMADYFDEYFPDSSNNLLSEWESSIGIPDACIPIGATQQERRDNIVLKLTSLSVQTEQDFIDLAATFGFTISCSTCGTGDVFPYTFPVTFPTPSSSYIWVVSGDFLTNPGNAEIFQCLVRILVPAVYQVNFINT